MCIGGSSPSPAPPPAVVAPPAPVDTTDINSQASAKKAKEDEMKRQLAAKGQDSTILSGALGDTSQAPIKKATLLGQGVQAS